MDDIWDLLERIVVRTACLKVAVEALFFCRRVTVIPRLDPCWPGERNESIAVELGSIRVLVLYSETQKADAEDDS